MGDIATSTSGVIQSGPDPWAMTITIGADSFHSLKGTATDVLRQVEKAETFKQLPTVAAWSGGFNGVGPWGRYSVTTKSPIQDRIKQLREEADALEAGLQLAETTEVKK